MKNLLLVVSLPQEYQFCGDALKRSHTTFALSQKDEKIEGKEDSWYKRKNKTTFFVRLPANVRRKFIFLGCLCWNSAIREISNRLRLKNGPVQGRFLMIIEDILKSIESFSIEEKQQFFSKEKHNLARYVSELIHIMQSKNKALWPIAIQTIIAIGYPHNEPAIAALVEHLCDANWPGWEDAVESLTTIDPTLVAPFFIKIFLDEGEKRIYWKDDVEEICLALSRMGNDFIVPCLPSLLFLFSRKDSSSIFDRGRLFIALNMLHAEYLTCSMPIILQIVQNNNDDDIVSSARLLLKKVSQPTLELYKYVFP